MISQVKSDTIDEDSSHQQDEKNATESDIAEIQEDKEEAHERHRSIEIHVADIVKDEIANCELEDINIGNSIGNKEATEASQCNGENTSISDDEVQLPEVQEETTIHKLEDAEDDANNITDAISTEEVRTAFLFIVLMFSSVSQAINSQRKNKETFS